MRHLILIRGIGLRVADVVFYENLLWHRPARDPEFHGSMALLENNQSFINEDPNRPAAERALVFEARRIPRGLQPAVFDSGIGSFRPTENATCDEVEQSVAAPEPAMKYCGVFVSSICAQETHRVTSYVRMSTPAFVISVLAQSCVDSVFGPLPEKRGLLDR
jgi:hypothetical protein